jgi:hypothetical protein
MVSPDVHRTGVALIGESGGLLAGVGELEQANQPVPGLAWGIIHGLSL